MMLELCCLFEAMFLPKVISTDKTPFESSYVELNFREKNGYRIVLIIQITAI